MISRRYHGLERFQFGDLTVITSLLFADDVFLLASSVLQLLLDRFVTGIKFEANGSQPEKDGDEKCLLRVEDEPQGEELKYLRVLFTRQGRMKLEVDKPITASSAVTYQSIIFLTLTAGHELWVVTKRR